MEKQKLKWYWHIHHDILLEPLPEPIEKIVKYIKRNRPQNEIETRLKLLKPVKGKIPNKVVKAWGDLNKVYEDYEKAWKVGNKAWKDYIKESEDSNKVLRDLNKALKSVEKMEKDCKKAWKVYGKNVNSLPEVQSLHKKECPDCSWNGKSIL